MNQNRFDTLTRIIGEQADRRSMIKTTAVGTMTLLGMTALGQNATAASDGFEGDSCDENADCRTGLICNNNDRCEYKKNCGGKKGDACKNNGDCCNGKNLRCQNRKCKRDN